MEYFRYNNFTDVIHSSLLPASIILAAGIVLFILGLIGCIGALRENKCLMGCYFSLMLLALIGLACGVGLAYMYRGIIDNKLHDAMVDSLKKYPNDTNVAKAIDEMQKELKCCGVDNYTDWKLVVSTKPPASCCKNNQSSTCPDTDLYKTGCYSVLRDAFIKHIVALYAVVGSCGFLLLVALMSACFLMRSRQPSGFIYRDLSETDGMRV